jgi:uncharacterized membrane protein
MLGLGTLVGAELWASNSLSLLNRHFWFDEILTYQLVADPDLGHSLRALANGGDNNPPALQLLLRGFTGLVGNAGETTLRLFALSSMLVASGGIYACLRLSFTPLVSAAAVLALWCHPLVVFHAFDARFYGPWLAAIAWFAFLLVHSREQPKSLWSALGIALTAALVCTIHYFGIFTWAIVLGTETVARRRLGLPRARIAVAAAAGPLALAACLPIFLGQRSASPVVTWMPDTTWKSAMGMLEEVLLPHWLAALVIVAWLAVLLGASRPVSISASAQAPLTSLLLLPFILIAFSLALQPATLPRYSMTAVAGLAPVAAYLLARVPVKGIVVVCLLSAAAGAWALHARATVWQEEDAYHHYLIGAIRRLDEREPVYFESPTKMQVVCQYAPDLAPRIFLLDFEDGEIGNVPHDRILMRDLARRRSGYYPIAMKHWAEVRTRSHFYLVPSTFANQDPSRRVLPPYPGYTIHKLNPFVSEAVRAEAES